jgi:hypothetical protein
VVVPILLTFILGIIEIGRLVMVAQVNTNAAREAARYASQGGANSSTIDSYARTYLTNAGVNGAGSTSTTSVAVEYQSAGTWAATPDPSALPSGTPELIRQLLNGPNQADFDTLQNGNKLASDGSLQAPVGLGGDTGISNGTKDDWAAIIGQNKIIPLYDTLSGNGNNASYHIVGFAGVRIVAVDMQGNPKRVWVQPTDFYSTKVTPSPPGSSGAIGVYAPPRLVIP